MFRFLEVNFKNCLILLVLVVFRNLLLIINVWVLLFDGSVLKVLFGIFIVFIVF